MPDKHIFSFSRHLNSEESENLFVVLTCEPMKRFHIWTTRYRLNRLIRWQSMETCRRIIERAWPFMKISSVQYDNLKPLNRDYNIFLFFLFVVKIFLEINFLSFRTIADINFLYIFISFFLFNFLFRPRCSKDIT